MKRRLVTALASAALLVYAAATPVPHAVAQTDQGPENAGRKTKQIQQSCPLHPEIKVRSAGKCPRCRVERRKMKSAQDKDKNKTNQQQQEGTDANE